MAVRPVAGEAEVFPAAAVAAAAAVAGDAGKDQDDVQKFEM